MLTILSILSYAQEFKSTIWIEDANGRVDSVIIGYDPLASESIDEIFGAWDITNVSWSEFEIRASQIDVTEIINGEDVINPRAISELSRYQTKIEIIPKNCLSLIEVSNQAGYIPFIALFIATDTFPIKVSWKQSEFENDCLSQSVISDWPISTWWDIPCCPDLEIHETLFSKKSEIVINKHVGMKVVNENQDTLIMLNIALFDALWSNTSDLNNDQLLNIFPNPSNGFFHIPDQAEIIRIMDNSGNSVDYQKNGKEIKVNQQGLIYVQMKISEKLITKRIINFWR